MSFLGEIKRRRAFKVTAYVVVAVIGLAAGIARSQDAGRDVDQDPLVIGAINFYGLRTISESEVRDLLAFSEGSVRVPGHDLLSEELELEVAAALNVPRVEMIGVCCMEDGQASIFIGIEETPATRLDYHTPPTADITLPPEVLQTSREIGEAMEATVRSGDVGEDWSEGHSLAENSEIRVLQERFLVYAEEHWDRLLEVLHTSSRPRHRAIAARVIAYAADKRVVVPHLGQAVLDSSAGVRSDATRALGTIAMYAEEHPELSIQIRPDVFIDMLSSLEWSDRNKASFILLTLTSSRDPDLLEQLQERALPSLIEMCRWNTIGHAFPSCRMLARVVGLPEQNEPHPKERILAMALELLE